MLDLIKFQVAESKQIVELMLNDKNLQSLLLTAANACVNSLLNGGKVLLAGNDNLLRPLCNFVLQVPSSSTPKTQEDHLILGCILYDLIEQTIFKGKV